MRTIHSFRPMRTQHFLFTVFSLNEAKFRYLSTMIFLRNSLKYLSIYLYSYLLSYHGLSSNDNIHKFTTMKHFSRPIWIVMGDNEGTSSRNHTPIWKFNTYSSQYVFFNRNIIHYTKILAWIICARIYETGIKTEQ